MQYSSICTFILCALPLAFAHPSSPQSASQTPLRSAWNPNITIPLFAELEELARIVDISYCVGTTGISKPFQCASRCSDFPGFELVETWSTGMAMGDSCGFMAIDHGRELPSGKKKPARIIVAFRGTYSLADTILDLSTVPQEYVPFPDDPDEDKREENHRFWDMFPRSWTSKSSTKDEEKEKIKCNNCTVHSGFWSSWQNTREFVVPHIEYLRTKYPTYQIHLVGHSLGGAVAALAGLEFEAKGWHPVITTFGEPRVGNAGLRDYVDSVFALPSEHINGSAKWGNVQVEGRYRRLTHVDDPVPLLPLQEWGYRPHAGEIYISKSSLQPGITDIRRCYGDEDVNCLAGAETGDSWFYAGDTDGFWKWAKEYEDLESEDKIELSQEGGTLRKRWGVPIPARYKMWQLFFAHRDYFWRLGLCVPGGDPLDWGRGRYDFGDDDGLESGEGKIEDESREDL